MATVALEGLEFYVHHGILAEEHRLGNRYEVCLYMKQDITAAAQADSVNEIVDYSVAYQTIKRIMSQPRKLLETLAFTICATILEEFDKVESVEVKVSKFNPPLNGICGRAFVSHEMGRSE